MKKELSILDQVIPPLSVSQPLLTLIYYSILLELSIQWHGKSNGE